MGNTTIPATVFDAVLNGLEPKERLKPGEYVKVVVE